MTTEGLPGTVLPGGIGHRYRHPDRGKTGRVRKAGVDVPCRGRPGCSPVRDDGDLVGTPAFLPAGGKAAVMAPSRLLRTRGHRSGAPRVPDHPSRRRPTGRLCQVPKEFRTPRKKPKDCPPPLALWPWCTSAAQHRPNLWDTAGFWKAHYWKTHEARGLRRWDSHGDPGTAGLRQGFLQRDPVAPASRGECESHGHWHGAGRLLSPGPPRCRPSRRWVSGLTPTCRRAV